MRLLTETPTHHPKNPVKSENFNHPTQGTRCNPGGTMRMHNVCTILRCNSTGGGAAGRAAAHRGPRPLYIMAEAHPGQVGDGWYPTMT
jgi:hypothetical protein